MHFGVFRTFYRHMKASVTKKYEDLLKTCIFLACVEFFTIAFDVNYSVETALSDRVWDILEETDT